MNSTKNTNFYQDKVYQLLAKVSKTEPTVELELYWLKRYQEIVQNFSFNLSEHTVDMVFEELVTRPSTPSGLINVEQIIDEKNQVQETNLQNIIETAVRLLDAILDIIHFDESAKKTVKEFRKIAIGIENLDSYLTIPEMMADQVDYLGELISNSVYRASESLAEEKGACLRWEDIKSEVSSKSFEYWFNPDSGEIRTSLEIQEYINNNPESQSQIMDEFEIVARRGSHLLLYANTPEWIKWSDRRPVQQTTSEEILDKAEDKVDIIENSDELYDTTEEETNESEIEIDNKQEEDLPEFLQKNLEKNLETVNGVSDMSIDEQEQLDLTKEINSLNQSKSESNLNNNSNSLPKLSKEHTKNFAFPDMIAMEDILPGLIGENQEWSKDEDDFSSIFGLGKFNKKPTKASDAKAHIQQVEEGRVAPIKVEMASEAEIRTEIKIEEAQPEFDKLNAIDSENSNYDNATEEVNEVTTETEPIEPISPFGIGELVKVISENGVSDFYQIVEITNQTNQLLYHLTDRDDAQVVKTCTVEEIQPALLEELILSANIGTRIKNEETKQDNPILQTTAQPEVKYFAQAIVFNQNGQVLLCDDKLPEVLVLQGTTNIDTLNTHLEITHNIAIKDVEEIGTFASEGNVKTIFLGQLDDESNQTKSKGLTIVDIDQALVLVSNLEKYLSKATEKEIQAKKRFSSLTNQLKSATAENQNLKQKIRSLGLNLQVLADEDVDSRTNKTNNIHKAINTRGDYNYLHITEHSKFSKFFPVIEQVIEDEEIGKITLKIQYDSFGAKKASIVVDSEKLRDKDYTLLTSYLNLVNTSLASGASLADVSYVLEHQGKGKLDFGNNLINKILLILSLCFLAMPRSIEQINSSDIIVVTLAKVLESINYNQSLLEIVLNDRIEVENSTIGSSSENYSATEKPVNKNSRYPKKSKV